MYKRWCSLILLCFAVIHVSAQKAEIQNILDGVHVDSLKKYVRQLSGEEPVMINGEQERIVSRHYIEPGNELAYQFIREELERHGYEVNSMLFRVSGKNIMGIKKGTVHPKQYVLLGAHYDSYPAGLLAPGADDNASGVAAVLEAARLFRDESFPYTIVLGLWDEEEIGLLGSRAYVQSIGSDNDTLIGYVNLDMIGWDGDDDGLVEINVRPVANSLKIVDVAQKCNDDYIIGLNLQVINPGPNASDFASFWSGGYSAIGINEVYYGADANPYWHTVGDTLGNFNIDYFVKCTKLALATIAEIASDTSGNIVSVRNYQAQNSGVLVYPNPFASVFNIQPEKNSAVIRRISVMDISGKVCYEEHFSAAQIATVSVDLPSGIYLLQVETENSLHVQKIVKL